MDGQLWVEPVGGVIIARVRGIPTEALLKEGQDRIFALAKETEKGRVLYDALEMEAPPIEVPLSQWKLDKEMEPIKLRRAIVVPNTRLAYLARIAFGDGDYRVFYNDLTTALTWLNS
jgi:hypothetical protein